MRSLLITVTLLLVALTSQAQTINFNHGYALVFPKDGIGFPVKSLQLYGDSIICLSPELRVYAKSDIGKILVRNEKPPRSGAGIGTVLGVYSMHYLIGHATNQPGAFLSYNQYGSNTSTYIWTTLLGIAVGGGLGYLLDGGQTHSALLPYFFTGNAELVREQWRLFAEEVGNTSGKPKFHLTVSGGSVTTPTNDGYRKMLENEEFTHFDEDFYSSNFFISGGVSDVEKATNFNMLRKISAEYSITDNIRAGLTATWLSEPAFYARKGDDNVFSSPNEIYEFLQKLDGKGYYATGSYHYYLTPKKDLEVNGMLGLGIATMNHEISGWYRRNSNDTPTKDVVTNDGKYFSFITSVGLSYSPYRSMSLGITANYFHGGSAVIDEMFIIDVPQMEVTYSTMDIGFTIGLHF